MQMSQEKKLMVFVYFLTFQLTSSYFLIKTHSCWLVHERLKGRISGMQGFTGDYVQNDNYCTKDYQYKIQFISLNRVDCLRIFILFDTSYITR